MAVLKNLFIDLGTDSLADWQQHGEGAQSNTTLEPDCSFTLHEELSTNQCWLLEAVLSVSAAPLDPDGARLWAYFHKHDPATYTLDTYAVQVRLEDDAGTKKLVLYDVAATPSPVALATLVLDQGWDFTDNAPRIRVRLRLDVDAGGTKRTLHLEAEPSDDPLFDKAAASLSARKDLDEAGSEVQTLDGSLLEVGFGNFGAESSTWESVHVTLAEPGTALPYWPVAVEPDTDHASPLDNVPGYRIFSPGLGEVTVEFDCQDNPGDNYLGDDRLTLSLEVSQGTAPADQAYGSVPAGTDSHTFTAIDDEQNVIGKATVCDVSGRCTTRQDTVLVDNSGPSITITDVSPDYANTTTEVVVEFTSNEPLDEGSISVTVGGETMDRDTPSTTPYRYTYTPTGSETAGPQTVVVQASDPTGNSSEDTNVGGVNFDFIVPTIDAAGASVDNDYVPDGETFQLFVEVTDVGSEVDPNAFTVTLNGREMDLVEPPSGSTFQFEYQVDSAVDTSGPQSVEVCAHDMAGNEATATLSDVVTFDFDPPSVAIADKPDAPVGDGVELVITLTVTDDYATVDDTSFTVTVGGQPMTEGDFDAPSYQFKHTASSAVSLEGDQDIEVTVRDEAGNETTQTFSEAVIFDFSPPEVALEDPAGAPVGDGALVHVTLTVTDTLSDVASVTATLGGRGMNPGVPADSDYPFSLTVNSSLNDAGAQDLVVTATDTAGNVVTETFLAAASYDFEGPVVTVTSSPSDPQTHDDVVTIDLKVTDDLSQIDIGGTFEVTLGGRKMTPDADPEDPSYPFTLTVSNTEDSPGPQDLVVKVRDAAGNETVKTFEDLVVFDFGGPAVAVTDSPADPLPHAATVSIDVSVNDDQSDIATVTATLGGRDMAVSDPDVSTYTLTLEVDSGLDSAGLQNLVVTAINTAGLETVAPFSELVTYDFEGPTVTVTDSPTEPLTHGDPVSIELNITDDYSDVDTVNNFTVTLGGRPMAISGTAPTLTTTLTVDNTQDLTGDQDLVVTVRDTAGNETVETFPDQVTYDWTGPVVNVTDSPAEPLPDLAPVSITVSATDSQSDIAAVTATLGGRDMAVSDPDDSSYTLTLDVDSSLDDAGLQNLVVTVHNNAGLETVQPFDGQVTYDFEGPLVTVTTSPDTPLNPNDVVSIELSITDDYSDVDTVNNFSVTLGGREMAVSGTAPTLTCTLTVSATLDSHGPQDLVVTVRDTAGNETSEIFPEEVTYDLIPLLAVEAIKITLVCAKGDDGHFHQQYDPEIRVTTPPADGVPYDWETGDVIEWNDITPGTVTYTIEPYDDSVWQALPDGDPRKEPIRLGAIVPVTIDVPDGVWLNAHDLLVDEDPWIKITATVNGDPITLTVFLRTLTADDFLVFEKQDRAEPARLSLPSEPGTVVTWGVEKLAGIDGGFSVDFAHDAGDTEQVGGRIVLTHTAGDWPALGASGELLDPDDLGAATFDLKLSQPGHADSYLPCDLRLRKLLGDRHLCFFGQVYEDNHPAINWKESAVIGASGETFSGVQVSTDGEPLTTPTLLLNELLGLADTPTTAPASGPGDPVWNDDQTFNLRIRASETTVVPAAFFDGRTLCFRELAPETLHLTDRLTDDFQALIPGPHEELVTVAGSTETWVFGDLAQFDLESDLDADATTLEVVTTALGITWDAGDLSPRETGELAFTVLRADSADVPLSPPVRLSLPVEITRDTGLRVLHLPTSITATDELPAAHHDLRYKGELEGLVYDLQDGDLLEWSLVTAEIDALPGVGNPLELEKTGEQEFDEDDANKQAHRNAVQTPDEPVAAVIPQALTAQPDPYTLQVSVTHSRPLAGGGTQELAGGKLYDLKLHVHATPDNFDVAILLDRSGSMGGNRWQAACDGADLFASLMQETGVDSRVGVYWFWGQQQGNVENYPNDSSYGTFPAAAGTDPADQLTVATNRAVTLSDPAVPGDVYSVCHPDGPDEFTALGAGLLHCRDELVKHQDDTDAAGAPRGRMVLLLSDGMENRNPRLKKVFFDEPNGHWNLFQAPGEAGPTLHPEGPGIRVHSVAMLTSNAWANKLRDVAAETGGLWALDVQHIRTNKASEALALTENWFLTSFAGLFDFDESAVMEDPSLAPGATVTQKLSVNLSMDTLVFYHLSGAADLNQWDFTVRLPDVSEELTLDLAAAHESVTYRHGQMYQMYVVRFPLDIPGHEHRWAGDWTLKLTRKATASQPGHYGLGALSRQDLQCRVDVLTRPRPRPGDEATVQVQLRDRRGNRIRGARVATKVYNPGPWAGDAVAKRVATDKALVKKLQKSNSKANRDMEHVADRVLRQMVKEDAFPAGRTYNRRLTEVGPGLYETRIRLPEAGHYQLDTTVRGEQRFSAHGLTALIRPHLRRLRRTLPLQAFTKELKYLQTRYTTRQPFSWAAARHVSVLFEPSARRSVTEAWFQDDTTIRLDVAPADKRGSLLGPGYAEQITFRGPAGISARWPVADRGDGHYWVDISLRARNPRFELGAGALAADRLELIHPSGPVRLLHDRLPITGFTAEVLGVRLPLRVQALVGNRANCTVHLATCPHARKIRPAKRVLFHDLEDASKAGFDTCEHCLPLLCNMDPNHLDAHKPFCSLARRIAPKNQLEVYSIKAALALGFNGCVRCLPLYHEE